MVNQNIIKSLMEFKHANKSLKITKQLTIKQFKENEKFADALIELLSKKEGLAFLNKIDAKNITFSQGFLGVEFAKSTLSLFPDCLGIMTDKGYDYIFNCQADNQDLTVLQAISEQSLNKAKHYGEDVYLFTRVYYNLLNGRVKNKFNIK